MRHQSSIFDTCRGPELNIVPSASGFPVALDAPPSPPPAPPTVLSTPSSPLSPTISYDVPPSPEILLYFVSECAGRITYTYFGSQLHITQHSPVECVSYRASRTVGHGTTAGRTRPACRGRPAAAVAPLQKPFDTGGGVGGVGGGGGGGAMSLSEEAEVEEGGRNRRVGGQRQGQRCNEGRREGERERGKATGSQE